MIYQVLKPLVKLTLNSYFKNYKVQGTENIPLDKPVIFVANHPSAFMDPLVVAAIVKQQLHFIAAGEFFGKGLKKWIFKNQFNMIPVYRPSTLPNETHKNDMMFKACYDHLGEGGSILIFPEGNSITEKGLREIKTGVARIALGAEKEHDFNLDVHIVPIGLNYSDPHVFRSDLFVNVGKPVRLSEYSKEPNPDVVREITDDVQTELRECVLYSSNPEVENLADKVEKIYSNDLKNRLDLNPNDPEVDYQLQKDVISAIEYFDKNDHSVKSKMEKKINRFLSKTNQLGIDESLITAKRKFNAMTVLKLIFGFPFFILGLIINVFPYNLTIAISRRLDVKSSFFGSLVMGIGMGIFLIWYILGAIFIGHWSDSLWLSPVYLLVAYLSGLLALEYRKTFSDFTEYLAWRRMKKDPNTKADELQKESDLIIEELEQLRQKYVSSVED